MLYVKLKHHFLIRFCPIAAVLAGVLGFDLVNLCMALNVLGLKLANFAILIAITAKFSPCVRSKQQELCILTSFQNGKVFGTEVLAYIIVSWLFAAITLLTIMLTLLCGGFMMLATIFVALKFS